MKKNVFLFALVGLAFLSSCKKEEEEKDLEKPSINITSPTKDATINSGTVLNLKGIITDNKALSEVKLEIHNNFDGHSHEKKGGSPAFEWDSIYKVSGTSYNLDAQIAIPTDVAAGKYHVIVKALDASGNESDKVEVDIIIVNILDIEAPKITNLVFNPALSGGELHLHHKNSFSVNGVVSDNLELDKLKFVIIRESDDKEMWEKESEISGASFNFSETINMQSAWGKGHYELLIIAIDAKGNRTTVDTHIHFD